jgi:hypothetical protein
MSAASTHFDSLKATLGVRLSELDSQIEELQQKRLNILSGIDKCTQCSQISSDLSLEVVDE